MWRFAAFVIAAGVLAGCDNVSLNKTDGEARADATRGADIFVENCAVCHGLEARGDGPAVQDLGQQPANLRLIAQRAGGVFPADDILAKIHGYQGPGHFGDMPDFGVLIDGPKVMWKTAEGQEIATSADLVALVRYLEEIQE